MSSISNPKPKTWDDYEADCLNTFGGGHTGLNRRIFRHGMSTVFSLLKDAFPSAEQCAAAPKLLAACEALVDGGVHYDTHTGSLRCSYCGNCGIYRYGAKPFHEKDCPTEVARAAIAQAKGETDA